MKLYHGTNGGWLQNVGRVGLEPRGSRPARDNWKHVAHRSNRNAVYLTDSYAPYFAFNAQRGSCAVVEVDTDRFDETRLTYDEDAWEQLGRGQDGVPGDMSQRTIWWRRRQGNARARVAFTGADGVTGWRLSLCALGTCCHLGPIAPAVLTRAVVWPYRENVWFALVWDPSITLINQRICGDRYRALTAKLFGDPLVGVLQEFDQRAVDSFDPARIVGLRRLTWENGGWRE